MSLEDILGFFRGAQSTPDRVIPLADPEVQPGADDYDGNAGAYFQIRLSEMYLTDKRRWHQEVAPASFVYTDFQYDGKQVRRPFFVSNALLPELPLGVEPASLRVRFTNTSVLGPVPYEGGDVDLFVGLFQTTIADWRKMTFQMLEKVFSALGPNPAAAYLDKISGLAGDLLAFLRLNDVKCVLAERLALGQHAIPRPGYIAYLRHSERPVPDGELQVHEGRLKHVVDGHLREFDATDYCLVRVQRLATRNDFPSMPFHQLWKEARGKALAGDMAGAQSLMLECARQVLASPELTERDKEYLIPYYQNKLFAADKLLQQAEAPHGAVRAGADEIIGSMSQQALAANDPDTQGIRAAYADLARVATVLANDGDTAEVDQDSIERYLEHARRQPRRPPDAQTLVRALTLGALATPAAT